MHESDVEAQFDYEPQRQFKPVVDPNVIDVLVSLQETLEYATTVLEALVVVNTRQYDALMSLVELQNAYSARELYEKHAKGEVFSPEILIPGADSEVV